MVSENIRAGIITDPVATKTITELVQHCIQSGTDPVVYAQEQNIDLKDKEVEKVLKYYSYKNQKELDVIARLAPKYEGCTRDCSNNFCLKHRMLQAVETFENPEEQIAMLKNIATNKELKVRSRYMNLTHAIYQIINLRKQKKESLLALQENLESIKQLFLNLDKEDSDYMDWEAKIYSRKTMPEYVDEKFNSLQESLKKRIDELNNS